jgi:hypothetical protein
LIFGTLEAVSFVPAKQKAKFMAKGIYGLSAFACSECGRLSFLKVDVATLKKTIAGS